LKEAAEFASKTETWAGTGLGLTW